MQCRHIFVSVLHRFETFIKLASEYRSARLCSVINKIKQFLNGVAELNIADPFLIYLRRLYLGKYGYNGCNHR